MDFFCFVGTAQSAVAVRAAPFLCYLNALSFRMRNESSCLTKTALEADRLTHVNLP